MTRDVLSVLLLALLLAGCDDMNKQAKNGRAPLREPPSLVAAEPEAPPPALTRSLVERGRDEFDAFCSPCHARSGDGHGMVVQRGFPAPPSFHTDQARAMAPADIYRVISDGQGVMYSFAARIRPADRWAITAYVKALQQSRNARIDDVPAGARGDLR